MSEDAFRHLNSILRTKEEIDPAGYNSWIVNGGLSQYKEWIHYANLMNQYHYLKPDAQYSFYINSSIPPIRYRKRWAKGEKNEDVKIIAEHYDYSIEKAKAVFDILTPEQIKEIKNKKGGVK